ncbi:MAG: Fe(3+) ABC transporter substrate-binding protein [Acidaminobacteraceae bacterium]
MKKILGFLLIAVFLISSVGCSSTSVEESKEVVEEVIKEDSTPVTDREVNVYSDRHYDTDQALYDLFTQETGIKVNIVKAGSDELLERLETEGQDTEADLIITSDVGRLYRANAKGLTKALESEIVNSNVPEKFRDAKNNWTALTMRARILAYSLDRVDPGNLSTYEALTGEEFAGKIVVRSSSNIYNQSLLASFIAINGQESASEWAAGIVNNFARDPKGNDRDQMKAVVAGEGDIAIVNTYYVGKMLNSSDPVEVEVAKQIGVFFPNQETSGTHINISGTALTKYGKNSEEATLLVEFLTSEKAQSDYANANYEYPVNPNVEPSELLKSFGDFKAQDIDLSLLGANNESAVKVFGKVGWQ